MDGTLNFDGKKYISAKVAASNFGYTSDYIGQLCRGKKVTSKLVGRSWYVLELDLIKYKQSNQHHLLDQKNNSQSVKEQAPSIDIPKKILNKKDAKNKNKDINKGRGQVNDKIAEIVVGSLLYKTRENVGHKTDKSRIAEMLDKKAVYLPEYTDLFAQPAKQTGSKILNSEGVKISLGSFLEIQKPTKFEKNTTKLLIFSIVITVLLTFGFESENLSKMAHQDWFQNLKDELVLVYGPYLKNNSIIAKSEGLGRIGADNYPNLNQLASVLSGDSLRPAIDWFKNTAYKIAKPWLEEETTVLVEDTNQTEKKLDEKILVPTVTINQTPSPIVQSRTIVVPGSDRDYIDLRIDQKLTEFKKYFLTDPLAPNVNRYYVTKQNDVIVSRLQSSSSSSSGSGGSSGISTFLELTDTQSSFIENRIPHTNGAGSALTDTAGFVFDGANMGIGTTTPYATLSVVGQIVGAYFTGTTTATSTFGGNLVINGTGTTTSNGGFDISSGCFAVNGTCISGGGVGSLAIGSSITSATPGSILFADTSTQLAQDNANFFWDDSSNALGLGTTTPKYTLTISSTTAPQLSLSAGAGLAQWVQRNAGGNFYLATTTVDGTSTTSISALEIAGGGFGTTTLRGLNISGQATSTSNVGINLSGGCFAVNGTCVGGGGSGLSSYDAWTHPLTGWSATTSSLTVGTSTNSLYSFTVASSTAPQIALSAGAGVNQWAFRNAGGNFYLSTTTVDGTATTSTSALAILGSSGYVGVGTTNPQTTLHVKNLDTGSGAGQLTLEGANGDNNPFAGIRFKMGVHTTGYGAAIQAEDTDSWKNSLLFKVTNGSGATDVPTEAMRIDYTGRVSIGSPTVDSNAKLTIAGGNLPGLTWNGMSVTNSDNSASGSFYQTVWGSGSAVTIFGLPAANATTLETNSSQRAMIGNRQNAPLYFGTNDIVRQTISASGAVGIGTTTPYYSLTVASTTAPQLSLSAGAGLAQWVQRNAGGNFYLATTTVDGTSTTSISALEIAGGGFGTTTLRGLNISGQATSTSNVGINLSGGCFAVNGTCVSGGGSGASTTLLVDSNTWTGTNRFNSIVTLGATALNSVLSTDASGNIVATSTPTFGYFNATSTSATSTIAGGLAIKTSGLIYDHSTNNVGINTATPGEKLQIVSGNILLSNQYRLRGLTTGGTNAGIIGIDGSDYTEIFSPLSGVKIKSASSADLITVLNGGNVGIGTTSPVYRLTIASSTALTDGAGLAQWVQRNAGGNFYLATTTVDGTSTTSISALEIAGGGFGTTTLRGLNISGQATSTSNVGINLSGGCFAVNGTCVGGSGSNPSIGGTLTSATAGSVLFAGSGTFAQDNANFFFDDTNDRLGLGTTTPFAKLSVNSVAGEAAFVVGSSTATSFIVNSLGNVGIKTISPSDTLDVTGTGRFSSTLNVLGSALLGSQTVGSNSSVRFNFGTGGTSAVHIHPNNTISSSASGYWINFNSTSPGTWANNVQNASFTWVGITPGYAPTSNTQLSATALDVSPSYNPSAGRTVWGRWVGAKIAPTFGSGDESYDATSTIPDMTALAVEPTINVLNTSTTTYTALRISPTETSIPNGINYIIKAGISTDMNMFVLTNRGNVGISTSTPQYALTVSSTTAPQLSLSAGAGLAQWVQRNAGGNFYLSTTTVDGTSTTSISALEIAGGGFGTTTLRGLNISGQATSTSNVGINITTGCYAINGTCVGGGSGLSSYDAWTHPLTGWSATTSSLTIGTSTNALYSLTVASSTAPQIALSAGAGVNQWAFRNAGGNFYLATTTVDGTATTSQSAFSILTSSGNVGIATSTPTAKLSLQATVSTDDLFRISSTTGASLLKVNNYGALVQTLSSTTAISIQDSSGNSVFAVDTTQTTGAGLDITAASGQTANLFNIYQSDGTTNYLAVGPSGNFGIGTGTPSHLFTVATSTTTKEPVFDIYHNSSGATSTVGFFVSTTTGSAAGVGLGLPSALRNYVIVGNGKVQAGMAIVNGGLCIDNDGWCTASTTGRISSVTSTTGGSDVAEMYNSYENLEPGDIVAVTTPRNFVKLADNENKDKVIGIVSTEPGVVLGLPPDQNDQKGIVEDVETDGEESSVVVVDEKTINKYPIALVGRVPVKVSTVNGPIAVGDYLTLSPTNPGVAVKAVEAGNVLGQALEGYSDSAEGKILIFVKNTYYVGPEIAVSTTQEVSTTTPEVLDAGLGEEILQFFENLGVKVMNGIAYFKNLFVEKLTVGTPEKPSGITLYDEDTGDPYCLKIKNGGMVSIAGECLGTVQVIEEPTPIEPDPEPTATSTPPTDGEPTDPVATTTPPVADTATSTDPIIIDSTASSTPPAEPTEEVSVEEAPAESEEGSTPGETTPTENPAPAPESSPVSDPTPDPAPTN